MDGFFSRLRNRFFDVRSGEGFKAVGLAVFFFLVIAIFWVLKPIKRGLLISHFSDNPLDIAGLVLAGAQVEQLGKVLNMLVAYGVVVIFSMLVCYLARHYLVIAFAGIFSLLFGGFALVVDQMGGVGVMSLYVTGDIWTTAMVATFWAFTNDINTSEQAERLYGLIGLGGVVGGFVGATVVAELVGPVGRSTLLAGAIVPTLAIGALATWIHYRHERRQEVPRIHGAACPESAERTPMDALLDGVRLVAKSRYLLGIVALVALYEVASNIIDFQVATVVENRIAGSEEKDAFFGFLGQITGIGSILIQLFVTTYILNRHGVRIALFFLPVAVLLGSVGFLAVPLLAFAGFMRVSDNALNYSINQSAREALYTPTTRDVKYKAKAFIDMFVQRAAKVLSVGLNLGLTAVAFLDVRWLSIPVLLAVVAWLMIIQRLGRQYEAAAEGTLDQEAASVPDGIFMAETRQEVDT